MKNLVIAKKGISFSITHSDGYVANEVISHINEADKLAICESCAVYTLDEIGMVLVEKSLPLWLIVALDKTVGYKFNNKYNSYFAVDEFGCSTGIYSLELLNNHNKPFLK
jgi:hypothetical protein